MLEGSEFEELVAVAIPYASIVNFDKEIIACNSQITVQEESWNKILSYLSSYYKFAAIVNICKCTDCGLFFNKSFFVIKQNVCPFCYRGTIGKRECKLYRTVGPLVDTYIDKHIWTWFG